MAREYIATNDSSRARLQDMISGLSEAEMLTPMSDGWTVSAYLGHLAFWDRRVSILVSRWRETGFESSSFDPHSINDAMKPSLLLVPPALAAAEAMAAAEEADKAVADLPDTLLEEILAGGGVSVNRDRHRNLHLDEFEALFA